MDGETEHEHEDTHDEEQEAADAETRPPPSREERNKRVHPFPSLAPLDLSKALSAAVIGFDGSREDFDNFNVHLAFYLDSVMGNCIHCWTQPSRATTAGDRSGAHLNLE